jgi:hypothetical protein
MNMCPCLTPCEHGAQTNAKMAAMADAQKQQQK